MGIYSNVELLTNPITVEEAYGYDNDEYSAQVAMIESYQNSLAIFDGVIRSDIQESAMKHQGINESELLVFSEGVIGDLFNKIKEFFKKLWAKIKSVFHNFMAKWDSKMMSSNKEFIKKYRKDIYGKDLTDFEVEYRKRIEGNISKIAFPVGDVNKDFTVMNIYRKSKNEIDQMISDFDTEDYTSNLLSKTINNTSISNVSDYDKEFMDFCFEESSKDSIELDPIITRMMNHKDYNKTMSKSMDSLNKAMSGIIKVIEKDQDEAMKHLPFKVGQSTTNISRRDVYKLGYDSTDTKNFSNDTNETKGSNINNHRNPDRDINQDEMERYQKALNLVHKRASCIQTVASKFTANVIKAIKFDNSQNRRIIAKVIAYKRKEEAFSEAFADLIEWEADCVGVY